MENGQVLLHGLKGNIDQQHGGVLVYLDGGASFCLDEVSNCRIFATDTETFGCDPKKQTPYKNAILHSWSLAFIPKRVKFGMRGQPLVQRVYIYGPPRGNCLELLQDPSYGKVLHQSHYDLHTFENAGVKLAAMVADTLRLSRLLNPHLKTHGLKHLLAMMLGYEETKFKDLFSRPKRSLKTGKLLKTREIIPLSEITAEHELFLALVDYASLDAKATLEIAYLFGLLLAKIRTFRFERCKLEAFDAVTDIERRWFELLRESVESARENPVPNGTGWDSDRPTVLQSPG